jgi:predicted DsbA family dithiol-disulfide isomerase
MGAAGAACEARFVIEIVEYTDQHCSWAWGTEPKIRRLRWRYGERLRWRRVMGGLMPPGWAAARGYDLTDPDDLPRIAAYHAKVCATTGMPHPPRLEWAGVSSIEGNRAVKAAERQGSDPADRLLRRLREDWYVFGRPADTRQRILAESETVPGLDAARLARDLDDPVVDAAQRADWDEARNPNAVARSIEDKRVGRGRAREEFGYIRYGFPTLIFRGPGGEHTVPGWRQWEAYLDALRAADPGATDRHRPDPTPTEALARWPLLAQTELEFLCAADDEGHGDDNVVRPAGAVPYDAGGGRVWMTEAEATARAAMGVLV